MSEFNLDLLLENKLILDSVLCYWWLMKIDLLWINIKESLMLMMLTLI